MAGPALAWKMSVPHRGSDAKHGDEAQQKSYHVRFLPLAAQKLWQFMPSRQVVAWTDIEKTVGRVQNNGTQTIHALELKAMAEVADVAVVGTGPLYLTKRILRKPFPWKDHRVEA